MTNQGATPRWPFIAASLLVLLGIALVAVYRGDRPEALRPLRLYYGDTQAMFLVPVDAALPMPPSEPARPWAEALLRRMAVSPDPALVPVVGPEVRLVEAAWQAPVWAVKVEVGSGFGSAMERLLVGGVVGSLVASTPGAEGVQLSLVGRDGRPWESQHLDLSRPLTPADVANQLGDPTRSSLAATVWWRQAGGDALVPVRVPLSGQAGTPPADALARLVAGPPAEGAAFLQPVAPAGSRPVWAGLDGTVAKVALAAPLPADEAGARFADAAALTLTGFEGVTAVKFLVEGQPEGAAIARPDRVNPAEPEAWASPAVQP